MTIGRTLNAVIAIAGFWEIASPFILGFANVDIMIANNVLVGIALVLIGILGALSRSASLDRYLDVYAFVIGAWLIVAPFLYALSSQSTVAAWSSLIVGAITVISSGVAFYEFRTASRQVS